jgi:peptidoglycan/xylan/chitin deacetylase (PgdA/CDA1 family)
MRILKEIAYWLLVLSGLSWVATRLNRGKILVLLYHGVGAGALDPVLNFDGLHVRVEHFERQMRYLAAHYSVITLDQLLDGTLDVGARKPLAAITFDDGYRNLYRHAYPVLRRLGLPATVFVISDFLQYGRAPWWDRLRAMVASTRCPGVRVLTWGMERWLPLVTVAHKRTALRTLVPDLQGLPPEQREELLTRLAEELGVEERELKTCRPLCAHQLREMARAGISVGAHGRSHDSFLHLNRERLLVELIESKHVVESVTGRPVHWLAYPYGDFSREAVEAAIEAGYRGALTTIEGLNDGIPDPFAVRRIGVDDTTTLPHFIVAVSGLRDMLKALLTVCRRWRSPVPLSATGRPERRYAAYVRDCGEV